MPSGKCLDVSNALTANGTGVILYTCNGGANQKWAASYAQTSTLRSAASGRCLDNPHGVLTPGNQQQIWDCGVGNTNQKYDVPVTDDEVSLYSQGGDDVRNPDVLAPGQSIAGLRAPGSFVDLTFASATTGASSAAVAHRRRPRS